MRVHTDWLLTPQRAAVHLPTATAVIADLHLGYSQARCRQGEAVPCLSLDRTLAPIQDLLAHHPVRKLIIAGDVWENSAGCTLAEDLPDWLAARGVELTALVPGNHDRGIDRCADRLPLHPDGVQIGDWQIRHGDGRLPPDRTIFGHFHPYIRWRQLAAPCFLVGSRHIVLPAFSADAAGVNVLRQSRWRGYRCCVIAGDQVLDCGTAGAFLTNIVSATNRCRSRSS